MSQTERHLTNLFTCCSPPNGLSKRKKAGRLNRNSNKKKKKKNKCSQLAQSRKIPRRLLQGSTFGLANLKRCVGDVWAMFRKPQPLPLVEKVRQYTSNLYGGTPSICIAVLSWLLSFEERETLQYASHLYCSTPPICTAVRPHLYGSTFGKILGVGVTGTFLNVNFERSGRFGLE